MALGGVAKLKMEDDMKWLGLSGCLLLEVASQV